jgi:hypothetical protein
MITKGEVSPFQIKRSSKQEVAKQILQRLISAMSSSDHLDHA